MNANTNANPTIDILRGELERLFTLEEMTTMSQRLLGLDPIEVGGSSAKASFAKALTERCVDGDRLEALVDVILVSRRGVDPRVRDVASLLGREEVSAGHRIGEFTVLRKLGESELSYVYLAKRGDEERVLKVLRREACRDHRAVHRFLTANRLVSTIAHDGLPKDIEAGEADGTFYVAYRHLPDAQTLAARAARTGPSHVNELKPILRAILEPLAALHKAQLVHGDLKLENVLIARADAGYRVVLIDFGSDRLRQRATVANGHTGILAVFGSPKTVAPEQVRGRAASPASDVYAFGAMTYELLSGKPVFDYTSATEAAFAHVSKDPEPPSARGPRGWITPEVDDFVLSLLVKDETLRPKDAQALLESIESIGRASKTMRAASPTFSEERLTALVDKLVASPDDSETAIVLEQAVDEGASAERVAEAFLVAAENLESKGDEDNETKKGLLYRAARIFDSGAKDKARAEQAYLKIIELDPEDDIAQIGLDEVRKALGKYEEIVEMLVTRSEAASPGEDRARVFAEIGRLCANELEDPEQALVAFTRALCETPTNDEYVADVERLASDKPGLWGETLSTLAEGTKSDTLSTTERNALLAHAGRWYDAKLGRADLALMAYQQILVSDPADDAANEGLTQIYRRAQQWPELAGILLMRADAAATSPRARDLRTEAAELLETKLNDAARAKEIYGAVLAEDPGHLKATDALARIAEKTGDFQTLVKLYEKRAEARRGPDKIEALVRVAEIYEDHLNDLPEATRRFEAVLKLEPVSLAALKGLDRIYNRTEKYKELLENLERQIAIAATPRQKINLYERVAALHDEEFLDHESAAAALEQILEIDAVNDQALTTLPRHYRALGRFEDLVRLYEKHANATSDEARRVELLVARSRVLAEQVGSPERAMRSYEVVLELSPGHAGALEALAGLREMTGDAHAALTAIDALAAKAATPELKAEQLMRAARLLEARGDKDGAIERYKRAIEASPQDQGAALALRQAYAHRGDALSVVALIEKELKTAEGALAKARLQAELAKVYRDRLHDAAKAETAAKAAFELDPTNADALMVLGDLAFEAQRYTEASRHYETLFGRADALPKPDALRIVVRFIEAFGKTVAVRQSSPSLRDVSGGPTSGRGSSPPSARGSLPPVHPKIAAAVELLTTLAIDDADALVSAARAMFDYGEPAAAWKMYHELLSKHGDALSSSERADALYRLGESARRSGELDAAVDPLREAADTDPANPLPLKALAKIYEETGDWEEVVKTKRRRLEIATGAERFDLLLEIGDIEFQKMNDRARASKTYVAALEERPDDRKLLTKLMQLYSEEKDWAKLVEVVLRLADFVEDPKQRAKYMHTAAIVSWRQIGEVDQALGFYERAIEVDPTQTKVLEEAIELYRTRGRHDGVERLLKLELEQAKQAQDRTQITAVLDQLGSLYQKFLDEPELAIDAYEAAQAFDSEDRQRAETLAELYASDVTQYLDKAVKAQAQILRKNPYRVESYKLLRRLYTEGRRANPAWCLCQALSLLNLAEPDEERFYKRHRGDNAAPAQATLDDAAWEKLLSHGDADMLVTRLFAAVQPTIIRARSQTLEALGYDSRYALDLSSNPHAVAQTLYYVQGVLGMPAPPVFENPNDPGGLGFLHASTPSIVLGRAAFAGNVPNQSLAFVAGRHLTFLRAGYYVRQLVPTGTGLKAWLFAAIKLCVPQFPVAPDLQGQVNEAMEAMNADFQGVEREKLASLVSKLLQAGGAIDLKKWVAAIDLTADRAGFVLAHDLGTATEVIRATEDASSVPSKERMKEIVLFSVSEDYFALRERLQITIEA